MIQIAGVALFGPAAAASKPIPDGWFEIGPSGASPIDAARQIGARWHARRSEVLSFAGRRAPDSRPGEPTPQ